MVDIADLVNDLIPLIPKNGSRISNDQIRAALEQEAGEPLSDAVLEEVKNRVVAMGDAEKPRGAGGGLKAPGVTPPPRPQCSPASYATRSIGSGMPSGVAASLTHWRCWSNSPTCCSSAGQAMRRCIFPEGSDGQGRPWSELRWSRFKELGDPASMFRVVGERVFPFLRELGGEASAYATHMRDARFTIPTPALLTKVVELLDASEENKYTLILANPPFAGSLDYESTSTRLQRW